MWAANHAPSWSNTKPEHTHSPMAGGLLPISTICGSSNENEKGAKAKSDGTGHLERELIHVLLIPVFKTVSQLRASSFHGLIAAVVKSTSMRFSLVSLAARPVHIHEDLNGWDTYARRVVKALFVLLILLIKFFVLQRGGGKDQSVSKSVKMLLLMKP